MEKTVKIDGREVEFRSTAAVPRLYRIKFGRDLMRDITKLGDVMEKLSKETGTLEIETLEVFENVAYIMAKHADPDNVPNSPEEWFEDFDTFSIYEVLPEILSLWGISAQTTVASKKK